MAITTTQKWKDEVVKQFRYPGRVRMVMELVSDVSKSSIEATATNELSITDVVTTLDNAVPTYMEIATMEGVWRADGTMYLPSRVPTENEPLPLMSTALISATQPLVLTYDFGQLTSFIGLTFTWDNLYNSWPTDLTLYGYDANGAEKYVTRVTYLDAVSSIIDYAMDNVQSIRLDIHKWSNPELLARISEVYFGVMLEFTDKQILSTSETTKNNFVCSALPTDTQKYTVKNQVYRVYPVETGNATSNKSHPLTSISRIFNSTAATNGIASVETRYWKADGELFLPSRIVEENPNIPWMSETADFSETDPVEVVISYETPVQLNTISFTWDSVTNSWPTDALVVGKDTYGNEVFSRNINATGIETRLTGLVATVSSVHLRINRWSQDGWRARIGQYEALMVYGNNNIPSEVNNLFDPTLQTGYSKYLARRQKVTVQYGLDTYQDGTLWLPKQVRFLDAWNIPADAIQVDLQSNTRLSFLTQVYQRGAYSASGVSFRDLALSVLENSNIITDRVDTEPWVLDDKLSTLYTTAPLPRKAENALLQLIAGATGCSLGTRPTDGYVTITSATADSGYVIDSSTQLQQPSITLDTPLRSIAVKMYNYTVDAEQSELFNGSIVIRGTKRITVTYNNNECATNCNVQVSGATVAFQVFYGYSAVFDLVAPETDTEVSIVIMGQKVVSSNAQVTTFIDSEVDSGRDIVIDNPLVTNMDTLNAVAQVAYAYYKRRNTASTKYLGYPDLKAGDNCAVYSQYLNSNGYITEHTFDYNGGFKGNVKVLTEV